MDEGASTCYITIIYICMAQYKYNVDTVRGTRCRLSYQRITSLRNFSQKRSSFQKLFYIYLFFDAKYTYRTIISANRNRKRIQIKFFSEHKRMTEAYFPFCSCSFGLDIYKAALHPLPHSFRYPCFLLKIVNRFLMNPT